MADKEEEIIQAIKGYIVKEFLTSGPQTVLDSDQLLVDHGIIDSLGIFMVVEFIQERFGIEVSASDLVFENFATVNDIKNLVTRKLGLSPVI